MKPTVFIATPIAAFASRCDYDEFRAYLIGLAEKLKASVTIFSAALTVPDVLSYDSPASSARQDFLTIEKSEFFVLIYPQNIPTSALVELGYALALKKKILILTVNRDTLPWMLREIDDVYNHVKVHFLTPDWAGLEHTITGFIV
ncbi:MAG: hypothetical protein FWF80_01730 [Defluviitaleaceae bacterium]|nr:hypothetical protein [Defluviitaleaceae bacterium]